MLEKCQLSHNICFSGNICVIDAWALGLLEIVYMNKATSLDLQGVKIPSKDEISRCGC